MNWFTDWIRIIFFLETWRAQGANHVFLYYHSSTNNVRKVLDNYGKQGFVTIIPWPSLPKNSIVDPNKSVYRLAHSLAHNDCILRIGSEFGALVDIDELIIPRHVKKSF
uniref:Glycosyltransferase family 92 protein n=1 Tax=Angiostrongylus cantonensis TaxID=6313 RepID=A0A0K0DED4_ANGCA